MDDRWPLFSTIRFLTSRHTASGAAAGTLGTIIEVYGTGYEVEVCDDEGWTLFLGSVADEDIELVRSPPPK